MPDFTPIRYASYDGLALHARDYAASALHAGAPAKQPARLPVICLHGLTRNASDFELFAPRIAAMGRRVLAADLRGRGQSAHAPQPDDYNTQNYVADVAALMAGQGIARAVFVGTSLGGLVTMALADRHLDLVAAAVLNDIGPEVAERGLARIAAYAGKPVTVSDWNEAAAYMRRINACAFPDNDDGEWLVWARRAFGPDASGRLALRYDPGIAHVLQEGRRRTTTPELQQAFRKLAGERPVLLARGALSDLLDPCHVQAMRDAAPALRHVEVPGVGHAPMLTEPAAFAAIAEFLTTMP